MAAVEVTAAVLGAGPAGSVAAAELARAGLPVALIGPPPPAGPYDVLVSQEIVAGVPHRPVHALDLSFDGGRRGELTRIALAGCRHDELVDALARAAVEAGAVRLVAEGTAEPVDGGWEIVAGGELVRARHLVRATGAGDGGGEGTMPASAQLCSGWRFGARAALHLPAPRPAEPFGRPTPVRLTPSSTDGLVTVAVVGDSIDAALERVAGIAELRPAGEVHLGHIRSGFTVAAGVQDGALVAGDAAGVVNPFSGTGIGTAVTTGRLAAAAIAGNAEDPELAARTYLQLLSRDVLGHTGPATQVARRYHLAWRVLADTAGDDHPFFAKGRKAILLPDGVRHLGERRPADAGTAVTPFLFAATEIAVAAVRREWPFVASLIRMEAGAGQQDVRPALLFAGAAMASAKPPDNRWASVAAATELAMLGMLALTGSGPTDAAAGRGVDWPSATAVLAGDFLLAQAARLVARHHPELSGPFADWMADLVAVRARRLATPPDATASVEFFALLFEFPARVAAQLADCPDETVARLREFGDACGRVFLYAEDLLALKGEPTRLDATVDSLRSTRLSALPALVADPDDRAAALAAATAACRAAHENARRLVGEGRSARVLTGFLDVLAAPAVDATSEPTQEKR